MVKKLVPAHQLLVLKLEDGLTWEQICPFLGVSIPDLPYPRTNHSEQFKIMTEGITAPGLKRAKINLVSGAGVLTLSFAMAWSWIRK
jgi:hypothetical protein